MICLFFIVERSSWNYYSLNQTEKVKRGVAGPAVFQGNIKILSPSHNAKSKRLRTPFHFSL